MFHPFSKEWFDKRLNGTLTISGGKLALYWNQFLIF